MDIHQKSAKIFTVVIVITLTSLISESSYAHVSPLVKLSYENPNPFTGKLGCLAFTAARFCADHSMQANHELQVNVGSGWSCVIDSHLCLGQLLLFLLCYGTKICGGWRSGMALSFLIWLARKYDTWSIGVMLLSLKWSVFWITSLEWPSPISSWWLLIQNTRYVSEIYCKLEFPELKNLNYYSYKFSYLRSFYFTFQSLYGPQNLSLAEFSLIYDFYNSSLSSMDKGKQKVHEKLFTKVVKSTSVENKNPTPSGDTKAPPLCGKPNKQKNKKQARKNQKHKSEENFKIPVYVKNFSNFISLNLSILVVTIQNNFNTKLIVGWILRLSSLPTLGMKIRISTLLWWLMYCFSIPWMLLGLEKATWTLSRPSSQGLWIQDNLYI